jgi:16S rRNA (guanine(966)-N(2))-methyltransferase RsmD
MDRVKEALFSILGRDIFDSNFLDLFAGTGSVAIEALSRGAGYALLVDNDRRAIQTIRDNLAATGLAQRARVRQADAFKVIGETPDRVYNYIYVAPPQYKALWTRTLRLLDASPAWLTPDTEVIVQIDPSEFESLEFTRLETRDERRYGNTLLVFYATRSAAGAANPEE